jgi:phage anti-repressor protein
MENKLDIIHLIEKNPLTRLSKDYQNKFVQKIQNTFTESQQNIFVSSFYCYLNYNSKTDFVIEFDTVWKWLGFSRIDHCKVVLTKHFKKDIDYIVTEKAASATSGEKTIFQQPLENKINEETRGRKKENILITINTFKKLCLKSNTKKADEIHDYFIKLEEVFQEIISEESIELKNRLEQKDIQLQIKDENLQKLTKEKLYEKHNILLREFGNIGSIVYIIKVKTFKSGEYIIKIGESRRGVLDRYNEHKNNYKNENVEDVIILDCFIVKNSKNFETFLHNKFKNYKVKDLHGHQNENELFLIGKELTYSCVLNIINQNIKYYNDDYTEIEKLRLENLNLIKIGELNKDFILKDFMKINEKLYNKIDNLENTINGLKSQINSITTKTTNNFNESLVTLGPRLQKINPETLQLIKVYESVSECIKENTNIKRPSLNKAVIENTIYQGYRWMLVDRLLDQNKIYNIKETKVTRIQNTGYIAKLNKDKTRIVNVYLDRKTAAKLNGYVSPSSLDVVVKKCLLSNEHYYILYDEVDEILKENFTKPVLYKNGVGKIDNNGNLIKEFTCKEDARIKEQISNKTLSKALDTGNLYGNYYYKFIGVKLQC